MMRAILAACLLCLSVAALAGQPDAFSAGMAAYKAQDYATALADFRLAAQQGVAVAQFNLGSMYNSGQGVPQDYTKALKWYRRAAKQGDAYKQRHVQD
jgi:TPR repeat protein